MCRWETKGVARQPTDINDELPFEGQLQFRQILEAIVDERLQIVFADVLLNALDQRETASTDRLVRSNATNFFEEALPVLIGDETVLSEHVIIFADG
jgi:hypothetical protein